MLNRDQIAHEYMLALMAQDRTKRPLNQFNGSELAYSIADAMIAEAEKRKNMERPAILGDGWISVKDRLPEDKQEVLIYRPEAHLTPACHRNVIICEYSKEFGAFLDSAHEGTHWQPLPSPPKP